MAQKMRGQVIIWVFVALGVTAFFVLLFSIKTTPQQQVVTVDDPVSYMQTCVRTAIVNALEARLPRGGIVDSGISVMYNNISRTYLCYTRGLFEPCSMHHPLPLETLTLQLTEETRPLVETCFGDLQETLELTGKETLMQSLTYSVSFAPDSLFVTIIRPFSIQDRGISRDYEDFSFTMKTPTYQLMDVAREIASQEAQFCYFEYAGYMILYPTFEIEKKTIFDGIKLYTVRDVPSNQALTFATRGCVLPAGL
ncbi:hypothetical protein EXS73_00730 [Candidatus Pacearchaeota archaeon]|nr:hypothetical protein [Candidatus Pacearchaeota archaeon]